VSKLEDQVLEVQCSNEKKIFCHEEGAESVKRNGKIWQVAEGKERVRSSAVTIRLKRAKKKEWVRRGLSPITKNSRARASSGQDGNYESPES